MNAALAALAVGVVAGGVVAVSARDARVSIVGLASALVFAPLVAQPFPDGLVLAARAVAAILAVYLLWIVARDGFDVRGSRLGWPIEVLIAGAAGLAGLTSGALTTPPVTEAVDVGLPEARAAAFAIAALAVIPILEGRDALRLGTGLLLAVLAAALLQQGMGSTPAPAAHVAFAAILIGVAATSASLGSLSAAIADRADRPLRAGAHPRAQGTVEAALPRIRGAEVALRRRWAEARAGDRVSERLAVAGERSRGALSSVRSARITQRAAEVARPRFPRRSAEHDVAEEPFPGEVHPAALTARIEQPALEEPAMEARPDRAAQISPRSAGARRSIRRRE